MKTLEKLISKKVKSIHSVTGGKFSMSLDMSEGDSGMTWIKWVSDHGDHCCTDNKPDPKGC
ncbi:MULTISPECIES: hypothetical protein [unclassified Pedobacter]|uniref:hypothetical protein n=1 Tax=unclassified Pedobacter TaxID=2628915 RepID=UPI0003E58AEB|nr:MULTISPECIES: hypothetical protein [unclassified Pedobacter]ETZ22176.1 hypothetical protein N824_24940 [Pedobacter sp. V48]SDJ48414.1 hypothetical protein SAMN04487898_10353 [Pedobacter sp. ok626]